MSEIRQNALTGEWVLIAPDRARRPHRWAHQGRERERRAHDPDCPFCPGNEPDTPDELYRQPGPDGSWRVRAFANAFPALDPDARGPVPRPQPVEDMKVRNRRLPGGGRHEVVVETPVHDRGMEQFSEPELLDVLRAYRARFRDAARDPRVRHVLIFRNQGAVAGASLLHPHAQLVGLPLVPPLIAAIAERSAAHARSSGGSLLLELVEDEIRAGDRIVDASDRWVAFAPFASPNAYEVWVAPRSDPGPFDRSGDELLAGLAAVLGRVLRRQAALLDEPDYNLILRAPPVNGGEGRPGGRPAPAFPWHLQIIPRLTSIAGFEIGVGLRINEIPPEEAAEKLRDR